MIATGGRHRPWSGGLGRFSLLLSTSLPWLFEPMSSITPQSARARIGQRTWASVAEQVKPARMMPTSPPSCKCTTRRYAFGRLRAVLCSSVWTLRSSVATLRAAIPRHPGLRLAQRGQDLTPSWRAPCPTACSVRGPTRPPSTRRTSAAAPCAAGVDDAIVPGVPCERLRIQPCQSFARGVTPPATVAPRGASRRVLDGRGPCAVQIRPPARPAPGRSFDTSPPPAPPDTNRDGFCPLPGPSRASTSAARSPQRAPGKARPARCDAGRDPAPPRARAATPGWHCGHTLRAGMYLNLSGTPAGGGVAPSRLWPPPPRAGMEKGPKLMVSTPG